MRSAFWVSRQGDSDISKSEQCDGPRTRASWSKEEEKEHNQDAELAKIK